MRDDSQGPPQHQPTTTPPQYSLDPGGALALQTAVEMQKSLGAIEAKLDRLISDTEKLGDRLSPLEKAIDRVRTGVVVGGFLISAFFTFAWWAIGDRITTAVHSAIAQQANQPPSRNP